MGQQATDVVDQPGGLLSEVVVIADKDLELGQSVVAHVYAAQRVRQSAGRVSNDERIAGVGLRLARVQVGDTPHRQTRQVSHLHATGAGHGHRQRTDRGRLIDHHQNPDGEVPDLDELAARIEEAEELADRYVTHDPVARADVMKIRLTPLDPRRPARDLLEDLLSGIRGCRLLYVEYAEHPHVESDSDGEEADDALGEALDTAFRDEVRARAEADRDRLQ